MIRMNEMTWMEFKAKIDEGAITILPIGACEQHGPHLPLCVDTVLANGFAERLAERVGGMVAPRLHRQNFYQSVLLHTPWHYSCQNSWHCHHPVCCPYNA